MADDDWIVFPEERKPKLLGVDLTTLPTMPARQPGGLKKREANELLDAKLAGFQPETDVGLGRAFRSVDELKGWADRRSDWPHADGQPIDGRLAYLHRRGVWVAFWTGYSIWHFAYQNAMKGRTKQGTNVELSIRGLSAEIGGSLVFDLRANTRPGDLGSCDLGNATEIRSSRKGGPLQIYPADERKHPGAAFVLAWPRDYGRDGYIWFYVGWMTPEEAFAHPEWSGDIDGDKQQLVPWQELHPLPPPEVPDG